MVGLCAGDVVWLLFFVGVDWIFWKNILLTKTIFMPFSEEVIALYFFHCLYNKL